MLKIDNYRVYDLEESIIASGLPMKASYDTEEFTLSADDLAWDLASNRADTYSAKHFNRICKLADTPIGSGHNNAISGILVAMNITATVKWWEQFQRYHFKQIVSSMSTMHKLRDMIKNGTATFNEKADSRMVAFMKTLVNEGADDETLAYSCPMGLELTARVTTNYLQLRTMYHQRKSHKLEEWHSFCEFIKTLPYAKELITGE